jgi:hypothetical protein
MGCCALFARTSKKKIRKGDSKLGHQMIFFFKYVGTCVFSETPSRREITRGGGRKRVGGLCQCTCLRPADVRDGNAMLVVEDNHVHFAARLVHVLQSVTLVLKRVPFVGHHQEAAAPLHRLDREPAGGQDGRTRRMRKLKEKLKAPPTQNKKHT